MVTEIDVRAADGRTLHVYDTGPADAQVTVHWHHGTPNTGDPPGPLLPPSAKRGVRWVSHDRPGYGGSTPLPGRDIGSVAADVTAVTDALGIGRFAVMGHSGGGPHALACAALLPERVAAVVSVSGLAPLDASPLDWFAGMRSSGEAELRAATRGRGPLEHQLVTGEFDPGQFTAADQAALDEEWSWLLTVVRKADGGGPEGMVEDDLAYVAPWGFDPGHIAAPILLVHGGRDRVVPPAHADWLAQRCPAAKLWRRPDDGHLSVLHSAPAALDWLVDQVAGGAGRR